jgi:hypothetical protein
MNRSINLVMCSVVAATLLAGTTFLPSSAAPKATPVSAPLAAASQAQPQVFTVRYVCFVAKKADAITAGNTPAKATDIPPIMDDLQHGSKHSMATTPEAFLNELRAAQTDQKFQVLLCGSFLCINGSQAAGINAGPQMDDAYQCTLNESMFLEQNSPVMLTLHHTGAVAYTENSGRDVTDWNNMHTDNIVIGRTYSQGINQTPDGRCFVYAFCVLPGNLDQTASAWSKAVKAIAARMAAHSKTAVR